MLSGRRVAISDQQATKGRVRTCMQDDAHGRAHGLFRHVLDTAQEWDSCSSNPWIGRRYLYVYLHTHVVRICSPSHVSKIGSTPIERAKSFILLNYYKQFYCVYTSTSAFMIVCSFHDGIFWSLGRHHLYGNMDNRQHNACQPQDTKARRFVHVLICVREV